MQKIINTLGLFLIAHHKIKVLRRCDRRATNRKSSVSGYELKAVQTIDIRTIRSSVCICGSKYHNMLSSLVAVYFNAHGDRNRFWN